MKKYNYFDDEDEIKLPSNKKGINFAAGKIKSLAASIHGEAELEKEELRELPNLRTAVIRGLWILGVLLVIIIMIVSFSISLSNKSKRAEQFASDAGNVCINYIKEYGSIKWEELDESKYGENKAKLTGLCYARQMDFNGDSRDELMLCYNDDNIYYLEIWGYHKSKFSRLYKGKANSSEESTDGYWVTFYSTGGKYYICKSDKSDTKSLKLYALKRGKFKQKSTAEYDIETGAYYYGGKEATDDFETIQLSCFRKSRADIIVDLVSSNIDAFGDISSKAISNNLSSSEQKASAYYEIVNKRIEKYGKPEIVSDSDGDYIDGVAMVKLIDFDGDDNDELVIIYRTYKSMSKYDSYTGDYIYYDVPRYSMDIYRWDGNNAVRVLNKDSISRYFDDDNVFYLLLKKNKNTINLCSNTYDIENSYNYTAMSKQYKLKKGIFKAVYSAKLVNDYGYKSYYIDDEKVYTTVWNLKGYKIPMFLDDEDTLDAGYEITYFSGEESDTYEEIVAQTNKTINSLNPDAD